MNGRSYGSGRELATNRLCRAGGGAVKGDGGWVRPRLLPVQASGPANDARLSVRSAPRAEVARVHIPNCTRANRGHGPHDMPLLASGRSWTWTWTWTRRGGAARSATQRVGRTVTRGATPTGAGWTAQRRSFGSSSNGGRCLLRSGSRRWRRGASAAGDCLGTSSNARDETEVAPGVATGAMGSRWSSIARCGVRSLSGTVASSDSGSSSRLPIRRRLGSPCMWPTTGGTWLETERASALGVRGRLRRLPT